MDEGGKDWESAVGLPTTGAASRQEWDEGCVRGQGRKDGREMGWEDRWEAGRGDGAGIGR